MRNGNKLMGPIIPKEQALNNRMVSLFKIPNEDLEYFSRESSYSYLLKEGNTELIFVYGKPLVVNKSQFKKVWDVLRVFGPYSLVRDKEAKVLEKAKVCKTHYGEEIKCSCGNKSELLITVPSEEKILCPICFNKSNEAYIIGENCFLFYQLPF